MPATVRLCVIDLGTNSFHAVLVDVDANGTYKILDRIKELVHLGEGGLSRHRLGEAQCERSVEALRRIRLLADGWGVEEYLAFATSAIREADNGGDLIERIREELGLRVRTISGETEGRLIYLGVRRAVPMTEPTLIVDIGGGSTEFVVGTSEELSFVTSLKIGAARMTERFVSTDPVDRDEFERMRAHYRKVLRPTLAVAREYGVREIVGSSGTMENIGQLVVNATGDATRTLFQQVLPASAVRQVTKTLIRSSRSEREQMAGLDARRVDQVVAGAMLTDVLIKDLGVKQLRISSNALREGMVEHFIQTNYRRLERLVPYEDVRRRSVYELAYRSQWEKRHAEHVAHLALVLFDATQDLHRLSDADRELLEFAALLHDIGYHISRRSHHKHSLYLIQHADLRGFQPEEVTVMAYTARYHRAALPKDKHTGFQQLPKRLRKRIVQLAALLRLAEGLDRSHFQNVRGLDVEVGNKHVTLRIDTASDPQLDVWGSRRGADLFEHVFGRSVVVDVRSVAGPGAGDGPG